jgi:hypothetical protein
MNDLLGEDVALTLRDWRASLALLDHRYEDKGLLTLIALAMSDERLRYRLIHETEDVLNEVRSSNEHGTRVPLPEGFTLKFFDNTSDTLHVVLPPQLRETRARTPVMRELLRSRTELFGCLFNDDWNTTDLRDSYGTSGRYDVADPSTADWP